MFTDEPSEHRVIFSQDAISSGATTKRSVAGTRVSGLECEERIQDAGAAMQDNGHYTPRSTLNSLNSRAGKGVSNLQTMLMGRLPSALSTVTGPQAR